MRPVPREGQGPVAAATWAREPGRRVTQLLPLPDSRAVGASNPAVRGRIKR